MGDAVATNLRSACESCRRKKTKCTGERPVCSLCQRLEQICVYQPRQRETTRRKRRTYSKPMLQDRVRSLEAQTGELYDFIRTSQRHSIGVDAPMTLQTGLTPTALAGQSSASDPDDAQWSSILDESLPPSNLLDQAVENYRNYLYFQPLPLFSPQDLRHCITMYPSFLQWIFLAVTLCCCGNSFHSTVEAEMIQVNLTSARDTVWKLALRGTANLEVSQALCLLANFDILSGSPALALIPVAAASRLELVRRGGLDSTSYSEAGLRCYWSVYILETAFMPRFTILSQNPVQPDYLPSPCDPSPLSTPEERSYPPDLANIRDDENSNQGITGLALQGVTLWSHVVSYLHSIRMEAAESPSQPNSTFYRLTNKLHQLEGQSAHKHFVRNAGLTERSLEDVEKYREYWAPWLLFQIGAHATEGLLNHPFIHLVVLRRGTRPFQPRMFLQQTIDQAMFHAGWVARLAQMCLDAGFASFDPLIADMVAATATIHWLLQYARCSKTSETSKENYHKCMNFLSSVPGGSQQRMSKLEILRQLQTVSRSASDRISFQPSKIWQLIDPDITDTAVPQQVVENVSGEQVNTSNLSDTTLSVQTTFVHPVVDRRSDKEPQAMADPAPNLDQLYEGFEQYSLDSIFFESLFN